MATKKQSGAKPKARSKRKAKAQTRKKAAQTEPKTIPTPSPSDPVDEATAAPFPGSEPDTGGAAVDDESPPEIPAPEPPPARKSAIVGRIVLVGAVLSALIIVAGATQNHWLPIFERFLPEPAAPSPAKPETEAPAAPAESPSKGPAAKTALTPETLDQLRAEREQLRSQLKALMARIETMETAVDNVKDMVRATQPPMEKVEPDPKVEKLTERLDQLEMEGGTLKNLLARVDQLEKSGVAAGIPAAPDATVSASPDASHARTLVLAVASLREAIAGGAPFKDALETLTASAGEDAEVKVAAAVLSKHAVQGVPTLATLRERFGRLAGRVVRVAKAPDDGGWMQRAMGRLASLVTWRRVDGRGDDIGVDAIVARTEERLKAGNLAGAVEAAERLTGKAAGAAAAWLADAKARLACERAVATLHLHAVSLLAPGKE